MIKLTLRLPPENCGDDAICDKICGLTGLTENDFSFELIKKSLDARRGDANFIFVLSVDVPGWDEKEIAEKCGGVVFAPEEEYRFPAPLRRTDCRPVVAGFGPAGIFAGLMLARCGYRPIILEKGKQNEERKKDVDTFFSGGALDESSNIQFGEGGAGAFSDGKLNTLIKDKSFRGRFVLRELVGAGAPQETLFAAHPHIGTDLLRGIIAKMRREIISLGGEIRFREELVSIETDCENRLSAVITDKALIETDTLFLATGQSSESTARMLFSHGADIIKKPFSVGMRIEHPRKSIDIAQYGNGGSLRFLPPAEYKLFTHCRTGRTVYSFCMCPGGYVVAAASENGRLLTNGMSLHARSGENSNSAILCEVLPEDIGSESVFAGYAYREELERRAYSLGGSSFAAPCQTVGSYLRGNKNADMLVSPTYPRGTVKSDLSLLFTPAMNASFREALADFGKKISGFDADGAVLTAVESRTSSPIRIVRYDDRQSSIKGIYPLGEGAGYAGGIVSAAIDGIRSAEEYCLMA